MKTRRAERASGPARWAGGLALAVLAAALPGPAAGAGAPQPPAPPPPSAWTAGQDLRLEIEVRQALNDDRVLRRLNIGVRARKGQVTLWGPVSSKDDEERALEIARQVRGPSVVRSELRLRDAPPSRPAEVELGLLPGPGPTRTEVALPDRESGSLTLRHKQPPPSPPAPPARPRETGPGEGLPPIVRTTGAAPPGVARAEPPAPPRPAALLAPVPLGGRPGAAATGVLSLEQLVERTRLSEERFRLVRAEVQGSVVFLRAGAARPEDVTALAAALQKVPGVGDVVMDD
jgi:hypothetical protein